MQLPFHGVYVCGDVFFAAKGGNIHSFSTNGTHISCWKYPVEIKPQNNGQDEKPEVTQIEEDEDNDGPPAKRVKLENGAAEAEAEPVKIEVDEAEPRKRGKKQRGKGRGKQQHGKSNIARPSEQPMVIIMASTKNDNASHLVAVTSDKSIWVFKHDGRGGLTQLSRRYVDFHTLCSENGYSQGSRMVFRGACSVPIDAHHEYRGLAPRSVSSTVPCVGANAPARQNRNIPTAAHFCLGASFSWGGPTIEKPPSADIHM